MKISGISQDLRYTIILAFSSLVVIYVILFFNDFDFISSDTAKYISRSESWESVLFDRFHLPLYPLLLRILNFVPATVTTAIFSVTSYILSIYVMSLILGKFSENRYYQLLGLLVFSVWPFIGVTEVAIARADTLAILFLLLSILMYLDGKSNYLVLYIWLGFFTHKALWVFLGLIVVISLIQRTNLLHARHLIVLVIPPVLFFLAGMNYYQNPVWMLSSNLSTELAPSGSVWIASGILGNLLSSNIADIAQGLSLLMVWLTAVVLLVVLRRKMLILLVLIIPVVLYGLVLNDHEIWAMLRFSKPLAIPIVYVIDKSQLAKNMLTKLGSAVLIILSFASNVGFAIYVATQRPI